MVELFVALLFEDDCAARAAAPVANINAVPKMRVLEILMNLLLAGRGAWAKPTGKTMRKTHKLVAKNAVERCRKHTYSGSLFIVYRNAI
jgi:hypothetical protein